MSGEAQLEALLDIINASARQAIVEYKKTGDEVPTVYSKTYHPIDSACDTVALKKAVKLLEGACQQLCASLAPPQHTLFNFAMPLEWSCIGVVSRAKVADALDKFPEGLHVDELAKLVNLDKGKLARILRLLATKGCFTEVAPNTFANNRISIVTLSGSNPGILSSAMTELQSQGAAVLYDTMTDPEYATSYELHKSPLMYIFTKRGFKGNNMFEWIRDAGRLEEFHLGMIGEGAISGSLSVLYHYPWNEVNTVCDVGSSVGTFTLPLSKMYPHLNIVNQDIPEVLANAKLVWAKDAPEALENRVEFVPLNFLEHGPVQGQDVYYLRSIIHDWPDTLASVILRNVKNAMGPHSRLLIHGYVVMYACRHPDMMSSFGTDIAPEPLLPNYGNGNNRMYQQDMNMWLGLNAKERTLDEYVALGRSVGLRLEKVYDLAETSVIEFRVDA